MSRRRSWVASANTPDTDFPVENLPLGVFSPSEAPPRQGVAIGDQILDIRMLSKKSAFAAHENAQLFDMNMLAGTGWNALMSAGATRWRAFRALLNDLLTDEKYASELASCLFAMAHARLHLPFKVAEFTDFYASRTHAANVGTMFRGRENALPPNWLHMPIGYNGRASSVVVSGTGIRRPWGQVKPPKATIPVWQPSARFDIELELGAIVGQPSDGPLTVSQADAHIFGYVLLNDWSARDIQAWEYQPLGPFQSKATATTISPWIVMKDALEPFRCEAPERVVELLPHLRDAGPMSYDISLEVALCPSKGVAEVISRTNTQELYYSAAQQLAHHSSAGSPMRVGDLLGSGTISGEGANARGSLLELSWNGTEPVQLEGGAERCFLEDGDEITFRGYARGEDYRIGFGSCGGHVLPALDHPFTQE